MPPVPLAAPDALKVGSQLLPWVLVRWKGVGERHESAAAPGAHDSVAPGNRLIRAHPSSSNALKRLSVLWRPKPETALGVGIERYPTDRHPPLVPLATLGALELGVAMVSRAAVGSRARERLRQELSATGGAHQRVAS